MSPHTDVEEEEEGQEEGIYKLISVSIFNRTNPFLFCSFTAFCSFLYLVYFCAFIAEEEEEARGEEEEEEV